MKKNKGFTMVELIAVMAISTILGALVLGLFVSLNNLFTRSQADTTFNDNSRIIFSTVENDIRAAKNITIPGSDIVSTTLQIGATTYNLPTASRVLVGYTKKVSGRELAYAVVIINDKIFRLKQSGTNLVEENLGYAYVDSDTNFTKSADNKSYTFNLKFKDPKRNTVSYQTVITPRN